MLSPKDIPQALREMTGCLGEWIVLPFQSVALTRAMLRKESTIKTVNTLLDSQPRWLRPKNREQMDQRIAGLSGCKAKSGDRRKLSQTEEYGDNRPQAYDAIPSTEFTETPLDDLFAFARVERFSLNVSYPDVVHNSARYATAASYQEFLANTNRFC
jgi:hypothetical protein